MGVRQGRNQRYRVCCCTQEGLPQKQCRLQEPISAVYRRREEEEQEGGVGYRSGIGFEWARDIAVVV